MIFPHKSVLEKYFFDLNLNDFQMGFQKVPKSDIQINVKNHQNFPSENINLKEHCYYEQLLIALCFRKV